MFATEDNSRIEKKDRTGFFILSLQLALLCVFCFVFGIQQKQGFPELLAISVPAFIIHAFLPVKWRPVFLLVLFVVVCAWSLGWVTGCCVLFVSAVIFTIAELRVKFWKKLLLLAPVVAG